MAIFKIMRIFAFTISALIISPVPVAAQEAFIGANQFYACKPMNPNPKIDMFREMRIYNWQNDPNYGIIQWDYYAGTPSGRRMVQGRLTMARLAWHEGMVDGRYRVELTVTADSSMPENTWKFVRSGFHTTQITVRNFDGRLQEFTCYGGF